MAVCSSIFITHSFTGLIERSTVAVAEFGLGSDRHCFRTAAAGEAGIARDEDLAWVAKVEGCNQERPFGTAEEDAPAAQKHSKSKDALLHCLYYTYSDVPDI